MHRFPANSDHLTAFEFRLSDKRRPSGFSNNRLSSPAHPKNANQKLFQKTTAILYA
jgi:hypothetical protein